MEHVFFVKYLDPAGPARNWNLPHRDFFKFSLNNSIGIILMDGSVVFLPLGEVEAIKTYLENPGDGRSLPDPLSRVCEITGDDADVILLKLGQPVLLGDPSIIPSSCCGDGPVVPPFDFAIGYDFNPEVGMVPPFVSKGRAYAIPTVGAIPDYTYAWSPSYYNGAADANVILSAPITNSIDVQHNLIPGPVNAACMIKCIVTHIATGTVRQASFHPILAPNPVPPPV